MAHSQTNPVSSVARAFMVSGTQISTEVSTSTPWKPGWATPTTVNGSSSMVMVRPKMPASRPKRFRQAS